jgi:adenylate cyclase
MAGREARADSRWRRVTATLRDLDSRPGLVATAKRLRRRLPGDPDFGDPLSTGGREQAQLLGRRFAEVTGKRPGVLREAGLSALQVWEAVSEAQGRGRGERPLAIVFTDLVEFSDWALSAGDDEALRLLRDVARAIEPAVAEHGGEVVKRLGDGMMAVFDDAAGALAAVELARDRLREVDADGYEPLLRAGVHWGRPRRIGGDYLGVDVNVAARLAQEAGPGEVLISGAVNDRCEGLATKRKRRFSVKGVPDDVTAYSVKAANARS